MDATIKELRDIASSINSIANWLTEAFSGNGEAEPETTTEPVKEEPALTLEAVRAILANKSRDASKLSEVDPAKYKALVADAEVLGNE